MSHYIPAYTEINGRQQKTICGVWVTAQEHSTLPTCRECADYLTAEAEEDALTAQNLENEYPEFRGKLVSE